MVTSQGLMTSYSRWRSLMAWMLILSLCIQAVSAKKELFPTVAPSPFPSISAIPSDQPSAMPTLSPAPSTMPSTSSAPSTLAPSRTPSTNPTLSPTTSPTPSPTIAKNVPLPAIGIDVVVSDEEGATMSEQDLEDDITSFIQGVLETHSAHGTFERVTFNFKVIVSSFRRRKLSAGLSIRLDGTVFYVTQAPLAEDLTKDLQAYFAAWGISELENHLQTTGLTTAQVAAVTVDGETVKPATSPSSISTGAKLGQPDEEPTESTSPAVIAGLAAGCAVLVAVLVFLLVKSRRGKSHETGSWCIKDRKGERVPKPTTEVPKPNGEETPLPSTTPQTTFSPISEEDDDHSIGDLSAAMSIYTTDDSVVKGYNAKRLDKVIAIARHQSDQMQERFAI